MANTENGTVIELNGGEVTDVKESKVKKVFQTAQKKYMTFKATKGGRWTIRILKGIGAGLILKETYNLGKKQAVPVMVNLDQIPEEDEDEESIVNLEEVDEENPEEKPAVE